MQTNTVATIDAPRASIVFYCSSVVDQSFGRTQFISVLPCLVGGLVI